MSRRKRQTGKWMALGATFAAVAAGLVAGAPAGATTNNSAGLPPPEEEAATNLKKVAVKWGHPLVGRNYIQSISRGAHILSGQLDIEALLEGEPEWFYGEISLRMVGAHGQVSNVTLVVYPLEHTHGHEVTAELIPAATISIQHPLGVPAGRIAWYVKPFEAIANEKEDPNHIKGTLRLNGHGPFKFTLLRGDDDAPPPSPLPKAKQIGK